MLYSIYPPEVVFSTTDRTNEIALASIESVGLSAGQGDWAEVELDGVRLIICRSGEGHAKVVRLISTDPRHFLDPRFSPGTDIKM